MDKINGYKAKINTFTAELTEPLDPTLRTLITAECDCYAVEKRDNQDGEFDMVYKLKLVGSTIVKQGDKKPIVAKSKRSNSQKLRAVLWTINPDETYYDWFMSKLLANVEITADFLRDK